MFKEFLNIVMKDACNDLKFTTINEFLFSEYLLWFYFVYYMLNQDFVCQFKRKVSVVILNKIEYSIKKPLIIIAN